MANHIAEFIPNGCPHLPVTDCMTTEDAHIFNRLKMFNLEGGIHERILSADALEDHNAQHARDYYIMSAFEVLGHKCESSLIVECFGGEVPNV